jgi:hypothetical protein
MTVKSADARVSSAVSLQATLSGIKGIASPTRRAQAGHIRGL